MEIDLPANSSGYLDWTVADPLATQAPQPSSTFGPQERRVADWYNRMVNDGAIRLVASGSVVAPLGSVAYGAVTIEVEDGDESMEAFVNRSKAVDEQIGGLTTPIDRATATMPAGTAVRLAFSGRIGEGGPYAAVDYLYRLPDGRSLTVALTGGGDAADPSLMDLFARAMNSTLRAVP